MICVSDDTDPNCCSSSSSVSAMISFGTGCPSLYRSGSRNSYLRNSVVIGGWAFDAEGDAFQGQERESRGRDHHFAGGPTLKREPAGQKSQRPPLRVWIRKANDDHGRTLR